MNIKNPKRYSLSLFIFAIAQAFSAIAAERLNDELFPSIINAALEVQKDIGHSIALPLISEVLRYLEQSNGFLKRFKASNSIATLDAHTEIFLYDDIENKAIALVELKTGKTVLNLEGGESVTVNAAAFSPNGKAVAVAIG